MTTKLTNDGILFNDGSLQTMATSGEPTSGWTKLGNGLVLQWGTFTIADSLNQVTVPYTIDFDTATLAAWACFRGTGSVSIGTGNRTKSALTILREALDTVSRTGDWFALGY